MQKTAYELRISDWSSDVCSSDLLEQEPGNGQALPFATRESVAPVPHDRVEAVRQQPDQVGDAGLLENRPDLVVGGVPLGIAEVGTDGVVEHVRVLGDIADDGLQRLQGDVADVVASDVNRPGGDRKSTRLNSSH